MRTLLVITRQASTATAIEAVLDSAEFQLIIKEDVADAEFLLVRGAIDATIMELELTEARALRAIAELKGFAPACPVIVYTGTKQIEWEEDAYLHGVQHVLAKPVRGKLLTMLLHRLFPAGETRPNDRLHEGSQLDRTPANTQAASSREPNCALFALRRFSAVLTHGLSSSSLLKQFLLLLREVMGVNRAIVFLRKPAALLTDSPLSAEDRWLRSACAIGLDQSVLEHFALSLGAGIGGHLHRQGRILRATSAEALASREITKEFQILGAQIAVPILDRQSLLGVAVFDERLTGEAYTGEELAMLFHLLEEVGLAIRNAWIHMQLQANYRMISEIIARLGSGCVVIGSSLEVLHANTAAIEIFAPERSRKAQFDFNDLPQQLGSMIFTVIKSGTAMAPFRHEFSVHPGRVFRLAIVPFRTEESGHTDAALLIVEEITEHERAQKLESEASTLRLVKGMAEHLAHEIGNAVVPLSTHQQMMKEMGPDPEFQESLSEALASGVKRITRLASQMNFLAREWSSEFEESVAISDLLVEAFHEAHANNPGKKVAQLAFNRNAAPWKVPGDAKALRHAFAEIMLNALQANPDAPSVAVSLQEKNGGLHELQVQVEDSGVGFTEESAARATEPFYSTRNVGMGMGLTVTRKIIESHHGRVEIAPSGTGKAGVVRISLPIR
jgi:signal transduction histidine kinase/DNA-binding NarL/FixJ family response regulator